MPADSNNQSFPSKLGGIETSAVYSKRPFVSEVLVTTKDTVRALLDRLPDDCSLDDVLYHLYVVQAIGRGLADSEAGRLIPHEEVVAEMRRKWLHGSAQ